MKEIILNIMIIVFIILCLILFSKRQSKIGRLSEVDKKVQVMKEETKVNMMTNDIDLKNEFNDINGCAVLYNFRNKEYSLYNSDMCNQRVSPYSTFKIISALSGLHNGIIKDQMSKMNYTGEIYPITIWNSDMCLREAFQTSCIWYFHQVIEAIGKDIITKELSDISYGNCDVSEWNGSNINPLDDLNGFWLDSSLKISPIEQVKILANIFEGNSIYRTDEINKIKDIMLVNEDYMKKVFGKTGSSSDGKAWFVGFVEKDGKRAYFAIYLSDNLKMKNISGNVAKEIALKVINNTFNE